MLDLFRSIYRLSAPYGRLKLVFLFIIALMQGICQVAGVTSVFPFLALVADPAQFHSSSMGRWIHEWWPQASDRDLILYAGIGSLVLLFVANASLLLGEVARAHYVHGLGHWLRTRVLAHIMSKPYPYFLEHNTGELLKKTAGDVMTFVVGVLAPFLEFMARGLTLVLLVFAIFFLDPRICLIMGGALGAFYWVSYATMKPLRERTSDGLKRANRGSMREALQALGGIKPIKLHGVEEPFLNRYEFWSAEQARLSKWIPVIANSPRYLIEPIAFGAMIALTLFTLNSGRSLAVLLPSLGVFALAGYRLVPNLQIMYGSLTGISTSLHALEEIRDELEGCLEPKCKTASSAVEERIVWNRQIRLHGVTFNYRAKSAYLFQGLEMIIPKNKFVALTGETGSGKSTLVDLVLGLLEPTEGILQIDETPITQANIHAYRAGIGVVSQDIFLIDDTLAANVAFGIPVEKRDKERIKEVLKIAQLEIGGDLCLETSVGERGVRLSGGQRQRIGLARALYRKPDFLVLDEATSALDKDTEVALLEAIERIRGSMTLLVIAHRLSTIESADLVYTLSNGNLFLRTPSIIGGGLSTAACKA